MSMLLAKNQRKPSLYPPAEEARDQAGHKRASPDFAERYAVAGIASRGRPVLYRFEGSPHERRR
jgi:hypothetical protein